MISSRDISFGLTTNAGKRHPMWTVKRGHAIQTNIHVEILFHHQKKQEGESNACDGDGTKIYNKNLIYLSVRNGMCEDGTSGMSGVVVCVRVCELHEMVIDTVLRPRIYWLRTRREH